jgi:type II secretory pathway component PulK
MKIVPKRDQSGIAIVIVMVSIFVLAGLAGTFALSMKVEARLAMNSNNETEMEWLGRSGVELARYFLAQKLNIPNEQYDSLNQRWAGGPGSTNDPLADLSLTDVRLGNGKLSVKIKDAERKYNINMSVGNDAVLQQALILAGVDASEVPTIIGSVQDWIDRDENTHINGAESETYQARNPPYYSKNGPFDDISELLLVNGVTPEIFWGPNSTNHAQAVFAANAPRSPIQSGALPNTPVIPVGLVDIFTTISDGKININTASATVLQMIPGIDESQAAAIVQGRAGPDGVDGTEDDMPYRNPNDLGRVGSNQQTINIQNFITTQSHAFEVQVDAEIGQMKRTYYALVWRNNARDVQLLKFNWK